jgi:hypothetical protein
LFTFTEMQIAMQENVIGKIGKQNKMFRNMPENMNMKLTKDFYTKKTFKQKILLHEKGFYTKKTFTRKRLFFTRKRLLHVKNFYTKKTFTRVKLTKVF